MPDDEPPSFPLWCRPTESPLPPPTADLSCRIRPPFEWASIPSITSLAGVVQGVWPGVDARDALIVSFMPAAVPGHRMLTWVEAPILMIGYPEPAMKPLPQLVFWESAPLPPALVTRHGANELHVLRGLARSELGTARLYTVLVRRDSHAWKLFLSLATDAGSGDELRHLRDDDARAGGVFGPLVLGGAA
jgi:hypothetical protein